jgi:beta-galactosidase
MPASASAATTAGDAVRWPRLDSIAYGGDYTPEQWPEEIWAEDVRLMREAGVNLVTVGVFSWALLEPSEGTFDFGWLDRVIGLLHDGGIQVDLATPTAAPPAWFLRAYPQARPVTAEGHVLGGASRQSYCPSSPAYARASARIAEQLATRYGQHPALTLWHVHNEYGCHVPACYCDQSARAFRDWLRERYGSLGDLNAAWGTAFWGQRYGTWDEIDVPRHAPTTVNPALQLDFMRFSSDAFLDCFTRERDILHRLSPGIPVTTNFMASSCKNIDYWRWAREVDVVSNDHYLVAEQPDNHIDLAMAADLTRSLAAGAPWLLMEHSTGAVNWQRRNIAKRPGEMRRNSLAHLARGADGILFYQWRASRSGTEKFHSAMVPHGGTDSRIWREVVQLGRDLSALGELRASRVAADAALVWDWESYWAVELEGHPAEFSYKERISAFYRQLWRGGVTCDFVHPEADLSGYLVVLVPSLYLTTPQAAANLSEYVAGGGTLVVSYFSGIVDASDTVHPGSYPGPLGGLLGVTVEEFLPLHAGEQVRLRGAGAGGPGLADGSADGSADDWADDSADAWAEMVHLAGAETILSYADGPAAGAPAVTRRSFGSGQAWYISTRPAEDLLGRVLTAACADAGLAVSPGGGVEVVLRRGEDHTFVTVINHQDRTAELPVTGVDLLTGARHDTRLELPGGEVRVLRQDSGG